MCKATVSVPETSPSKIVLDLGLMIQIISASDQFIATHLICVWILRPFVVGRGGAEWRCGDVEIGA